MPITAITGESGPLPPVVPSDVVAGLVAVSPDSVVAIVGVAVVGDVAMAGTSSSKSTAPLLIPRTRHPDDGADPSEYAPPDDEDAEYRAESPCTGPSRSGPTALTLVSMSIRLFSTLVGTDSHHSIFERTGEMKTPLLA